MLKGMVEDLHENIYFRSGEVRNNRAGLQSGRRTSELSGFFRRPARKYVGDYENAVYKHTYEERKGKSFDLYREHLAEEHYDRKIWMARDPRDSAVRMLFGEMLTI